ncbi:MAG: hypothetical protein ACREOI_32520 [bacterium]
MVENLTRKILAELRSGSATQDERCQNPAQIKKARNKGNVGANPPSESKEERLRRVINFGNGFYSIAEAAKISSIGEEFIRKWVSDGKLMLLSYPDGKRRYVSGIELSEVVIQHNLNSEMKVIQHDFKRDKSVENVGK